MCLIAPHIEAYLQDYMPRQRGCSPNTIETYSFGFKLLFLFIASRLKIPPCTILIQHLEPKMITDFLDDLETNRGCAVSTRNARLAGIKSFFRFIEYRVPALLNQIRRVLAIPSKKTNSKVVTYLDKNETEAILRAPDLTTRMGVRDYAMLQLALAGGLRASELLGLCLGDLQLQPKPCILVHGKGRKERTLPLTKETVRCLRKWLTVRGHLDVPELFVNARGQPMTRWGFAYILDKYVKRAHEHCPTLKKKRISPHVLRHYVPFRTISCICSTALFFKQIRKLR